MMPFGVRRPPAGVLVDGDGEVGVSDLIAGELLSDDLNTLDYYDMYPMRQMLQRMHVQDRRLMWLPTDRELPIEWTVDDLEDWTATWKQPGKQMRTMAMRRALSGGVCVYATTMVMQHHIRRTSKS